MDPVSEMTPPAAASGFLAAAGWGEGVLLPLAGDASFRRYFRVVDKDRRAILMDAPPPHEDPRPYMAVASHLADMGFGAPRILASDIDHGLVLIEDFGDDRMRERIDRDPDAAPGLYADAVDLLVRLSAFPAMPDLPPYDRRVLMREADLFVEWFMPAAGLRGDEPRWRQAWDAAFTRLEQATRVQPPVMVLRDYHAENIMILPVGTGPDRLGLLDFQDALAGDPAYDLVSLLQDARRDVAPQTEADGLARYLAATGVDRDDFALRYAVLGAQRNIKILGVFTRLWQRDGKPRYLALLPRVWGYLDRDLAHPALAEVKDWFAACVPDRARRLDARGAV